MGRGYTGSILHVNLSSGKIAIEHPNEEFYRTYMGGAAIGAYYVLRFTPCGTDPMAPENTLVFAPSVITGAPIGGLSRFSVTSKSPLTGGIGSSEGGGYFGPELKHAGFDAVVITGKAEFPVYLWVHDGKAEIREASHLWGMETRACEEAIRAELKDTRVRIAQIGPGGEKLVRYACITNNLRHFNGRGGMGAVMGSKNLKAIAARGRGKLSYADEEAVKAISRDNAKNVLADPNSKGLYELGTAGGVTSQNATGQLPTRNFRTGTFEGARNISGEAIHSEIFVKREGCLGCPVRCKHAVSSKDGYEIDPAYGGPEYETVAALGSFVGVSDLRAVAKANELCAKYTLDTISTGGTIAFAMECFENGLLTTEDTGGIELRFGDGDTLVKLVEMIAKREGIGDILAEGSMRAAERIGRGAERFAVHCKGQELPAHEPRVKRTLAVEYAVSPIGADHMSNIHDPAISENASESARRAVKTLGFNHVLELSDMGFEKMRFLLAGERVCSMLDTLDICMFCAAPIGYYTLERVVEIVRAITGWDVTLDELLRVGDRRRNLMRVFNLREGLDVNDDVLPPRIYEPLRGGVSDGLKIDREEFVKARGMLYELSGWDERGVPRTETLKELGLEWASEALPQ